MLWRTGVVVVLALAGCVESNTKRCGDVVCSETSVCSPAGDRCVSQAQLDGCTGMADGSQCGYPGVPDGVCLAQVCVPAGCGNGVVDPGSAEKCDDGNRISLDGCRADCLSDERCGDGVADLALGELCDCGDDGSASVPGCTMANANTSGANCRTDCLLARCGDDVIDPNEYCDDGNTIAGDGCRADCTGRWTVMASGTFADLFDVWGAGPNDVWAVGNRKLLHFDGTAWTSTTPPAPVPSTYHAVWGTASNIVYALADQRIDKWNGTQWSIFADLSAVGADYYGTVMYGTSATDFWIGFQNNPSPSSGAFQHYLTNGIALTTGYYPFIAMTGTATSVFAIVDNTLAFDNFRLVSESSNTFAQRNEPGTATPIVAKNLLALSDSDIFAYDPGASAGPTMRHFNGTSWTATRCCDEMAAAVSDDGFTGVTGDFIMAGYQGRITTSTDGTNWMITPSGTSKFLYAAWSAGVNRVFIVGEGGTILY